MSHCSQSQSRVRRSTSRVTGESGPVESVTGVTHAQPEPKKTLIGGVLDKLKETSTVTPTVGESPMTQVLTSESDDWYAKEMRECLQWTPSNLWTIHLAIFAKVVLKNSDTASYCENCGQALISNRRVE